MMKVKLLLLWNKNETLFLKNNSPPNCSDSIGTRQMVNYFCISFGPSEKDSNLFWNYRSRNFRYQKHAEQFGLDQLSIGGTIGYVVIKETANSWSVVDEIGTNNVSIINWNNTYKVQPAPKLCIL